MCEYCDTIDAIADKLSDKILLEACMREMWAGLPDRLADYLVTNIPRAKALIEDKEKRAKHDVLFDDFFKTLPVYEKKFSDFMISIWNQERKIILSNLKKLKKSLTIESLKGEQVHIDGQYVKYFQQDTNYKIIPSIESLVEYRERIIKDAIDNVLYPSSVFEKKIAQGSRGIYVETMTAEGTRVIDKYDLGIGFDVQNPEVQSWLNSYVPKFSNNLEQVSHTKLRRELLAGLDAGESIPELTKRVNSIFDNWDIARAERIARSETILASNKGAIFSYQQSGIVTSKIWTTFFDLRTCAWCEEMDGQTISVEETWFDTKDNDSFTNAEGNTMKLDYRNIGEPPLHPACRCTVIPVVDEIRRTDWKPANTLKDAKAWSKANGIKNLGTKLDESVEIIADALQKQIWREQGIDMFGPEGIQTRAEFIARTKKIYAGTNLSKEETLKILNGINKAIAEGTAQGNEYLIIRGHAKGKYLTESDFLLGKYNYRDKLLTMTHDEHWYDLGRKKLPSILDRVAAADNLYPNQWQGTYTHEWGHAIERTLTGHAQVAKRAEKAFAHFDRNTLESLVSGYASTNAHELAAECYTFLMHPDFLSIQPTRKNLIQWIITGKGKGW